MVALLSFWNLVANHLVLLPLKISYLAPSSSTISAPIIATRNIVATILATLRSEKSLKEQGAVYQSDMVDSFLGSMSLQAKRAASAGERQVTLNGFAV